MKGFKKKLFSSVLAGMMAFSAFALVGCDGGFLGDDYGEELSEDTTHLFIGVYDGGFGADSWEKMEKDFEAIYANEEFEPGKTGVDVHISAKKPEYLGDTLKNSMLTNQEDMYFTNADVKDFAVNNLIIDVSDVVKNTKSTTYSKVYDDTMTIEEKMTDAVKTYIKECDPNYSVDNYKYYGVPVFVSTNSLIYDVDLWEDESLYFTREYEQQKYENGPEAIQMFTSGLEGDAQKSYGQDGMPNTLDDGLPIDWDDFKNMLTQIYEEAKCTPITFSGGNPMYSREYFVQLYASYEGAKDFELNFTYNGTDSDDPNVGTITPQTGYKVFKQRGRVKAMELAEYIAAKPGYLHGDALSGASHTDAQDNFLYSGPFADGNDKKRVAMLIEGNWWEHEAQDTIAQINSKYPKYKDRRFGVMTFPYMDEKANKDPNNKVMVSIQPNSYAFIASKATPAIQEVAKLFLAFTTDDEYLSYYTSVSGAPRPFRYAVEDAHYQNMSYYKKSIWEQYKGVLDGSTTLLYGRGSEPISRYSTEYIYTDFGFQGAFEGTNSVSEPFSGFVYYGKKKDGSTWLTAQKLADIPYEKYKSIWEASYYRKWYV